MEIVPMRRADPSGSLNGVINPFLTSRFCHPRYVLLNGLAGGPAMSYVPVTLAIDPVAFISTLVAGITASLTLIIVLLVLSCGSDRIENH